MKIAIIPARGGSKRIPRKNIKNFHNNPIVSYSITAAIKSKCFDRVIVSTDDTEIARVATSYGAEVPFLRDSKLADDFTGTNAVVADTLNRLDIKEGEVCCIYATAPFVTSKTICRGLELLRSNDCDFAVTVTTFPFPIQRAAAVNRLGMLEMIEPKNRMVRSQDLIESYHDAGQVYWGRAESFINDTPLFSGTTIPITLPRYLVQDIDTLEDWIRAEAMFQVLASQGELE